jgi:hypothetical protein
MYITHNFWYKFIERILKVDSESCEFTAFSDIIYTTMWWLSRFDILAARTILREQRRMREFCGILAFSRAGAGAGARIDLRGKIPACGRGNPAFFSPDILTSCASALKGG